MMDLETWLSLVQIQIVFRADDEMAVMWCLPDGRWFMAELP